MVVRRTIKRYEWDPARFLCAGNEKIPPKLLRRITWQ